MSSLELYSQPASSIRVWIGVISWYSLTTTKKAPLILPLICAHQDEYLIALHLENFCFFFRSSSAKVARRVWLKGSCLSSFSPEVIVPQSWTSLLRRAWALDFPSCWQKLLIHNCALTSHKAYACVWSAGQGSSFQTSCIFPTRASFLGMRYWNRNFDSLCSCNVTFIYVGVDGYDIRGYWNIQEFLFSFLSCSSVHLDKTYLVLPWCMKVCSVCFSMSI